LKARGESKELTTGMLGYKDEGVYDDALSALLNLGYPAKSAKRAVEKAIAQTKDVTLEGLIKEALRLLA
jgi:Holliday junction resolvasome RuvABC DNA-binding subunit